MSKLVEKNDKIIKIIDLKRHDITIDIFCRTPKSNIICINYYIGDDDKSVRLAVANLHIDDFKTLFIELNLFIELEEDDISSLLHYIGNAIGYSYGYKKEIISVYKAQELGEYIYERKEGQ